MQTSLVIRGILNMRAKEQLQDIDLCSETNQNHGSREAQVNKPRLEVRKCFAISLSAVSSQELRSDPGFEAVTSKLPHS